MVKHSSRIELSQSGLKRNFNFLRKHIGKDVILSSVVKANAYGHGISQYVPMAEKCGIHHFSVASSFEAEEVLEVCSPDAQIMIMGIIYKQDIPWAIENQIEFYVYDIKRLKEIPKLTAETGKKAIIHLELETGANRTGILMEDFSKALTVIKKNPDTIQFEGLCSHFGGAETFANHFKIKKQLKKFQEAIKISKRRKVEPNIKHIASSAAALSLPETRFDLVRLGVAQYGFWPSPDVYYHHLNETDKKSEKGLGRIFTWKTDIMDVRPVKAGEFIGYGTAYEATHDMMIAVLPLGYSNGYPRGLSNRGYVLIKGKKAPIVGLINMNLFMVDVSHIKDVEPGNEVVLIGRQNNNRINVASFTNRTQLLNQEMMSRLPAAIPRRVVR